MRSVARAFTLVEIVVALTIVAVIAAIAIPTLKGLDAAERARAPMRRLAELVQETRDRAMREGRAYQIVFERDGIHASKALFPFENRDEFLKLLEEMQTPPRMGGFELAQIESAASDNLERPRWEPPWIVSIPFEQGTECEVLMWGDPEWDLVDGGEMRRWVFQPTGMVNPARIRLRTAAIELESGFDALTGEAIGERSMARGKNDE
jgi:prepilin-type N-terminal cleavage/methylation domain-containing protein